MTKNGRIHNLQELEQRAEVGRELLYPERPKILVGMATCGQAAGAQEVLDAVREEVKANSLPYLVQETGCIGWCSQEPLVDVWTPGRPRVTYGRVKPGRAREIVRALPEVPDPKWALARMTGDQNPVTGAWQAYTENGLFKEIPSYQELPLFKHQLRLVMRNCGLIDPASLEEYLARGGYRALWQALQMKPEEIVAQVTRSGLRGRGGAGFPTGRKWQTVREAKGDGKYVICNADEGDPGAYMDRGVLEGDPHSVLEGMIIGAFAMGAHQGVIYVREEYPLAVQRMHEAIHQAEVAGLLGKNIFGSGFDFTILVAKGAGAFVCGEETALIRSIEGKVGEPQQRPPYPAIQGLYGKPTCINNVETWANIPVIVSRGGEWFAGIGTEKSKGTKVFSLVGNVENTALIEVPMGTTLKQIVYEIGGGIPGRRTAKAVQTGGPSGGCIPAAKFDLPVDYDSLTQAGSIMGSGGMIVMDDHTCMVDIAKYFLGFLEDESCGKCFTCRVGTQRLKQIVTRISEGKGKEEELALLEELSWLVKEASLCGLGQTAPNPVMSTLRYFRDEYEAHIREQRCPAKVCRELITFRIDPVTCNGCGACVQVCSGKAILGEKKKLHTIDQALCTQCGACLESCKFDAVLVS
ncbi:MAG TPA: NADH-quinone oxidoreductase subunit NuoF [Terriglobales bacterium]|jgi:NADH-quinone oxidoreductase subunit F/NADP-reducing hydrogenase subunit HndC|nr:NADH-quinone oxidoreductase subunit NuoF [Terriglobales bacterium]